MKINREEFNKLNQLDRIEFRQRYESIYNQKRGVSNTPFLILILSLVSFIIGLLSFDKLGVEVAESFIRAGDGLMTLFIILVLFELLLYIASWLKVKKKLKELEEEYFSVKIKKRSNK